MPHNTENQTDAHLWQRLKSGNADALATMMRLYYNTLYGYGLKISGDADLTKDAIQNVFYYLWWKRDSIGDVRYPRSYCMTALRHELVKLINKNRLNAGNSVLPEHEPEISFTAEEKIISEQDSAIRREVLLKAINTLPKRQREIIYLKFVADHDTDAIAGIMGLQVQSVYNLLSEALRSLKRMLGGEIFFKKDQ